jgi:hypothetical protein
MRNVLLLLILTTLLTACSSEPPKERIDINPNIKHCIFFNDHIECEFANGNTYYMAMTDIMIKTSWDKSAWKKEPEVQNGTGLTGNQTNSTK